MRYLNHPIRKHTCIAAILILVLIAGTLAGCTLEPKLTDITLASEVDEDAYEVVTETDEFQPDTPVIYVLAHLETAPKGTEITAEWWYLEEDLLIDDVTVDSTEKNQPVLFSLTNNGKPWPSGGYEVRLFINGEEVDHEYFDVLGPVATPTPAPTPEPTPAPKADEDQPQLRGTTLATSVDPVTQEAVEKCTGYAEDADIFYLVTEVWNALPDETVVSIQWWLPSENLMIYENALSPEYEAQVLSFSLQLTDGGLWPVDTYEARLFIDGDLVDTVVFDVVAATDMRNGKPELKNTTLATAVDSITQAATEPCTFFTSDVRTFYLVTEVWGATPNQTKVTAQWWQPSESFMMYETDLVPTYRDQILSFGLTLSGTEPWPLDTYEVRLFIDGKLLDTVEFDVVSP